MKNYIKYMREFVGKSTILMCGAGVIVENSKGEILLQLRCDNDCWGLTGGAVEIDEVVEDTAKRELYEEAGLTALKLELFGVFSGKELHYIYPNGDEVSNIIIVYICREYSGKLRVQESEVKKLQFFKLEDIPEKLNPPDIPALKAYINARL